MYDEARKRICEIERYIQALNRLNWKGYYVSLYFFYLWLAKREEERRRRTEPFDMEEVFRYTPPSPTPVNIISHNSPAYTYAKGGHLFDGEKESTITAGGTPPPMLQSVASVQDNTRVGLPFIPDIKKEDKIYEASQNYNAEKMAELESLADKYPVRPYTAKLTTFPLEYYSDDYYSLVGHSMLDAYQDFVDKETGMKHFNISKSLEDATYNIFTNNCADAVAEALNLPRHENFLGMTTPGGVKTEVEEAYPDHKTKELTEKRGVQMYSGKQIEATKYIPKVYRTTFSISRKEYERIGRAAMKQKILNEVRDNEKEYKRIKNLPLEADLFDPFYFSRK